MGFLGMGTGSLGIQLCLIPVGGSPLIHFPFGYRVITVHFNWLPHLMGRGVWPRSLEGLGPRKTQALLQLKVVLGNGPERCRLKH